MHRCSGGYFNMVLDDRNHIGGFLRYEKIIELYNFANKKTVLDRSRTFPISQVDGMKPGGLWLSDESDFGWKKWCESEDFNLKNLEYVHKCKVNMDKILHISNADELEEFDKKYKMINERLSINWEMINERLSINWEKVKKEYSGILISPHRWEARLAWYYV